MLVAFASFISFGEISDTTETFQIKLRCLEYKDIFEQYVNIKYCKSSFQLSFKYQEVEGCDSRKANTYSNNKHISKSKTGHVFQLEELCGYSVKTK